MPASRNHRYSQQTNYPYRIIPFYLSSMLFLPFYGFLQAFGHLCSVMILRHFQRCGHKPLALIGGATGMIGDPSGKSAERNLLTEETLQRNMAGMKKQLSKFLDFDSDAPNRAELVNNYDWQNHC